MIIFLACLIVLNCLMLIFIFNFLNMVMSKVMVTLGTLDKHIDKDQQVLVSLDDVIRQNIAELRKMADREAKISLN